MKSVKKFLLVAILAVIGAGFGFSQEQEQNERIRFELNVADTYFLGLSGHGNTVDLGFEITTHNNRLGARFGVMLRTTDNDWQMKENDEYEIKLFPYAGISFFNGCFMVGMIPYFNEEDQLNAWLPYCGFNWDFDIIPIKPGSGKSIALRIGTDAYFDMVEPTKDPVFNFFTSLIYMAVPKVYLGVNCKFGCGW